MMANSLTGRVATVLGVALCAMANPASAAGMEPDDTRVRSSSSEYATRPEQALAMTNDYVLKFSSHSLGIFCYGGITHVYVEYDKMGHDLGTDSIARDKRPEEATRTPNALWGGYPTFAGPVTAKWTARDGTPLQASIDLDRVFPTRAILHSQDPSRIFQPDPMLGSEPTVLVEIDDRTINIYMIVALKLVKDPEHKSFEIVRDKTLAFSQTY